MVDTLLLSTFAFTGSGDNEWQEHAFSLTEIVEPGDTISIAFRERVPSTRVAGGAVFLDLVEVTSLVTDVAARNAGIEDFRLLQNYPNPFNPSTTITFSLPQRAAVTLKVYNLLGQAVATLIDGQSYSEGRHQVRFDASDLANGIYYYKIEAGQFADVKRMTLLK
ncbi:T9SS type A sorting domain-containing protein [candidate division KSB1 bacterium]|nr:T9SS type A sorting domain-containing protein [candidate division KSB1 bacterium]